MCANINVNALIEEVHVTGRTVEIDKKTYQNLQKHCVLYQDSSEQGTYSI